MVHIGEFGTKKETTNLTARNNKKRGSIMNSIPYGKAICYSGYRKGQSPIKRIYPTNQQIEEDLRILEKDFDYIRMYDAGPHA